MGDTSKAITTRTSTTPSPMKKEADEPTGKDLVLLRVDGKIKYSFPICEIVKNFKNSSDAHIRETHTGKAIACSCAFSTYNMDLLNRHAKVHNKITSVHIC